MPTCVIVLPEAVQREKLQLLAPALPKSSVGNMEFSLNTLGTTGRYIPGDDRWTIFDVYLPATARFEKFRPLLFDGLYQDLEGFDPVFIDGNPGLEEAGK